MPRLPEVDREKLSSEQGKIYDEIQRVRGRVRGPFAVWLRNAELAQHALGLQDMFAARVQLDRRLVQLMILVAARAANAQYAWYIHALIEQSATHILEQLASETAKLGAQTGQRLVLIAESDLNDPRIVQPQAIGGYGIAAQWNDDFHHALHTVLTGEREGYYADFGSMNERTSPTW